MYACFTTDVLHEVSMKGTSDEQRDVQLAAASSGSPYPTSARPRPVPDEQPGDARRAPDDRERRPVLRPLIAPRLREEAPPECATPVPQGPGSSAVRPWERLSRWADTRCCHADAVRSAGAGRSPASQLHQHRLAAASGRGPRRAAGSLEGVVRRLRNAPPPADAVLVHSEGTPGRPGLPASRRSLRVVPASPGTGSTR